VSEFVDECRREWRRLGVSDPIANEMAADLTADIEEAEAEGGSAEDVLGNSAFDARRFAGSWALARGVTAPPRPMPMAPVQRWPVLAFGVVGCMALLALGAAVLLGGRQSAAAAISFRSRGTPGSTRGFPGSPLILQHIQQFPGFAVFALFLLVIGVVSLGVAVLYGFRWSGGRIGPWEIRRYRARPEPSGT
jgi:hypothetical protein